MIIAKGGQQDSNALTYTHPDYGDFAEFEGKACHVRFKWGPSDAIRDGLIDTTHDELKIGINDELDGSGRWLSVLREHIREIRVLATAEESARINRELLDRLAASQF